MHNIDIDLVEMTLDVTKYVINRITNTNPVLGMPKKEEELKKLVGETITPEGIGGEVAFEKWKEVLVKATVPIDHPRHLAFVPASPTRSAIMFDLITSASCIHGAYWMEGAGGIFAENEAMRWLVSLTGMPKGAFGVFTSGGTAANLSAMVTAREHWRSLDKNHDALKGLIITSVGAHSSVKSMAKVIDAEILLVPTEDVLTYDKLRETIEGLDAFTRKRLFAVVATGGTTNAGIIDDLDGVARFCEEENVWFHVDAAYGGGALAADSVRHLFNGIEKADSITIDPHKWLFSPYDCGAILYKHPELAKKAHAQEGSYLDIFKDEGAQGFNPAEYQIQLTRRVRGLPLWFSLAMHGTNRYKEAIERGIELAKIAGDMIRSNSELELVREPSLSCVLFRKIGWTPEDYKEWTYENQRDGFALVTPTKWKTGETYETVSRFCFINPDTTEEDIAAILASMN
ncbi:glutamate decarboxylase [Neptunitalea chrysea]|uniref:Glutamate decarboxylase n=1 Tax=Neptunitalea chrysea TaxID=1647581 RepID=A0A9W6B893_9FLAO|nr:aminotransferase class V-fold PLP-dependent enzyme [Neptunitalea chrysea]GLB53174.1 glutamate decarboxylase [Neptunitalea chrysea]